MRAFGKIALVLAAGLLLAGPALAQPPGGFGGAGGFGGFGGPSFLLLNEGVQKELKLEKDQIDKAREAVQKVTEKHRDDFAKLRDLSMDERREQTQKLNALVAEETYKALGEVLKAEQVKRLQQIENQQAGIGLFAKENMQKTLKLNDEQKEAIDTINKDLQKDIRELFGTGQPGRGRPDPDAMRKMQAAQKEAMEHVVKVLNDDQKTTLKDLTGEPFEVRFDAFRPGAGFGAGGPGGPGGFVPGGFGGPSQPGTVLSSSAQERLKLTDEQKKQLEELQKDVDARLGKILTDEQKKSLEGMRQPRPAGAPPARP